MTWFWEAKHDCSKHGHYFEPRYDHQGISDTLQMKGYGDPVELAKALQPKLYVKDVCCYCGKTIKRDEEGT